MDWRQTMPCPEECKGCKEEDCYNCGIAGKRWRISAEDELCMQRLLALQGIKRLQKRIAAIDAELEKLRKAQ